MLEWRTLPTVFIRILQSFKVKVKVKFCIFSEPFFNLSWLDFTFLPLHFPLPCLYFIVNLSLVLPCLKSSPLLFRQCKFWCIKLYPLASPLWPPWLLLANSLCIFYASHRMWYVVYIIVSESLNMLILLSWISSFSFPHLLCQLQIFRRHISSLMYFPHHSI